MDLGLRALTAEGLGLIPVKGTKISLALRLKKQDKQEQWETHSGPVFRSLPADAGDIFLSLFRIPRARSNQACVPQLLNSGGPRALLCSKRSHRKEKPGHRSEEQSLKLRKPHIQQ